MSGPFDINGLGSNYFNSLQATVTIAPNSAVYTPAFTSSATSISAALTQMCNLDVPAGKARILLAATLTGLNATSNLLEAEIEVDGVVVLTGSAASYTDSNAYLLGYNSSSGAMPVTTVNAIQVNRNLKIRAKKPSSTAAVLNLWYVDRA